MNLAVISQDMTALVAYLVRIRSWRTTGSHLKCSYETIFSDSKLAVELQNKVQTVVIQSNYYSVILFRDTV